MYKQSAYTLNFALTRRQFRSTVFVVIESSEQQIIAQLAQRLVGVYPQVDPTHVSRLVQEEYARFDGRPIRDFIPLFVERKANGALTKLEASSIITEGARPAPQPSVR